MTKIVRSAAAAAVLGFAMLTSTAPALHAQAAAQATPPVQAATKHQSKAKVAVAGTATGQAATEHAKAGAATTAAVPHRRHKKAAKKS
jgi:hypothetical protein